MRRELWMTASAGLFVPAVLSACEAVLGIQDVPNPTDAGDGVDASISMTLREAGASDAASIDGGGGSGVRNVGSAPVDGGGDASIPDVGSAPVDGGGDASIPDVGSAPVDGGGDASVRDVGSAPVDGGGDASVRDVGTACDLSQSPSTNPCLVDDPYGVFVSPSGSDATGNGTRLAPYQSITTALNKLGGKTRVFACRGDYPEHVTIGASLDGIALYGGFDCLNGWTYSAGAPAVIEPTDGGVVLQATNLGLGLTMEDFSVIAPDATVAGGSSIAAFVGSSTAVVFRRVTFGAGRGADGASGTFVPNYTDSASVPFMCMNTSTSASTGGAGGSSAIVREMTTGSADAGAQGQPVMTPATPLGDDGHGGAGAALFATNVACGAGAAGSNGTPGHDGTSVTTPGSIGATGWAPQNGGAGGVGGIAQGGGGGGGGVELVQPGQEPGNFAPASGGSGGRGGCGGGAGQGGQTGGSSLALVLFDTAVTLDSCALSVGSGGTGGNGATGQQGQAGEAGGTSTFGCSGGPGGTGGNGGSGGAGAGGCSVGIAYSSGSQLNLMNTPVPTPGTPGQPGSLGANAGTAAKGEAGGEVQL